VIGLKCPCGTLVRPGGDDVLLCDGGIERKCRKSGSKLYCGSMLNLFFRPKSALATDIDLFGRLWRDQAKANNYVGQPCNWRAASA